MIDLSSFLYLISPSVPGCPNEVIKSAVRNACISLCEGSYCIRSDITIGDVVAGYDDYTITTEADTQPLSVISIVYNGHELKKKTEEELDVIDPGWRTSTPGTPTYVSGISPGRIRFNRIPAETIVGGLVTRVASRPTDTAEQVDDRLFNEFKDEIVHGALAELYLITGAPWFSMDMAKEHGRIFENRIQRTRIAARKGYMRKTTAASPRQWI